MDLHCKLDDVAFAYKTAAQTYAVSTQVKVISKPALYFRGNEHATSALLPNSPSAIEAQLAVLQEAVLHLCQRLDDRALQSTCLTPELALQQLGSHLQMHYGKIDT